MRRISRAAWLLLVAVSSPSGARADEPEEPCLAPEVALARAYAHPPESASIALTRCDGSGNPDALEPLSRLARPKNEERARREIDPGLLTRLQAIADAFPGRTIAIVSGHRPKARRGSRHREGRALDVEVEGVARERVVEVARALPETGVGYYPNSTFTHIDVREESAYWVDRSGPGERPDYGTWPVPEEEELAARAAIDADVARAIATLRGVAFDRPATTTYHAIDLPELDALGSVTPSTASGDRPGTRRHGPEAPSVTDVRHRAIATMAALRYELARLASAIEPLRAAR